MPLAALLQDPHLGEGIARDRSEALYPWTWDELFYYSDPSLAPVGLSLDDLSGNHVTGTVVGPTWDFGGGLTYNGTSDHVDLGRTYNERFDGLKPFTVSSMIRLTGPGDAMIAGNLQGSSLFTGFQMRLDTSERLRCTLVFDTTNRIQIHGDVTTIAIDVWYSVGVTYDGSQAAPGMRMYIDGILEPPVIDNDTLSSTISATPNFNLGRRPGDDSQHFTGQIARLGMWSREFSATEMMLIRDNAPTTRRPHTVVFIPAAPVGGISIPVVYHHRQRI